MNSITRKLTGGFVLPAAALAAIAMTAVTGPSASATDGLEGNVTTNCVTKKEYRKVVLPMRRARAQSIMGATPVDSFLHPSYPDYKFFDYRACGETGLVQLAVKNRKARVKAADWTYEWAPPAPPADGEQPPPPPGTGDDGGQVPW